MLPENRPEVRIQVVRVKSLNGRDHYRLQVESPTMDLHTIKQWSVTGSMPVNVFEDLMACLYQECVDRIPHQMDLFR